MKVADVAVSKMVDAYQRFGTSKFCQGSWSSSTGTRPKSLDHYNEPLKSMIETPAPSLVMRSTWRTACIVVNFETRLTTVETELSLLDLSLQALFMTVYTIIPLIIALCSNVALGLIACAAMLVLGRFSVWRLKDPKISRYLSFCLPLQENFDMWLDLIVLVILCAAVDSGVSGWGLFSALLLFKVFCKVRDLEEQAIGVAMHKLVKSGIVRVDESIIVLLDPVK
jgi:hypothetical protein